ncbi:unnamed protein product [Nesidiocoris tenuis]|uniref:Uncharacterized protein n=1 Tax=Nesidiocoris tenuis TaxID=355587 RepID=A0A6H5GS66_9HEMI|nr:unnamed protein product [Nesidiocoris tenuis]CAB0007058.1 unnamed protein product [Nesidiocoris tenuis]
MNHHQNELIIRLQVTQFHTEDEAGRVVFGFQSPDQVRMEAREPDGTVKGSYSYVDPNGDIVKMQYWDDGHGIHMAGNNLPVAFNQEPQYTPEVRAAREEHFRMYDAILQNLRAAGLNDSPDPERYPSGDYDDSNTQSSEEIPEEEAPPSDESVILENESANRDPQPDYQKTPYQMRPQNLPPADDTEDEESIVIENPELARHWARRGKSRKPVASPAHGENGPHNEEMDYSSSHQVATISEEPKSEQVNAGSDSVVDDLKALKPEDPRVEEPLALPSKQVPEKPQETPEPPRAESRVMHLIPEPTISQPLPAQVPEFVAIVKQSDSKSIKLEEPQEDKTVQKKVISDIAKPTDKKESLIKDAPPQEAKSRSLNDEKVDEIPGGRAFYYHFAHQIPQPVERVDDDVSKIVETSNHEHQHDIPVSVRASGLGQIPISAVHDSQVSPRQRLFLPNYAVYPVYIPPIKN